jgi:dihydrolipoamide dehydrogenase
MENQYDIAIIGSGPGGYVAAIHAASSGLSVAIIEKEERLGGTCLNIGCIPTKFLLHQSKMHKLFLNSKDFGITSDNIMFNYSDICEKKNKLIKNLADQISFLMKKNKITVYRGFGKIINTNNTSAYTEFILSPDFND